MRRESDHGGHRCVAGGKFAIEHGGIPAGIATLVTILGVIFVIERRDAAAAGLAPYTLDSAT